MVQSIGQLHGTWRNQDAFYENSRTVTLTVVPEEDVWRYIAEAAILCVGEYSRRRFKKKK
jgi:hypothetical protein